MSFLASPNQTAHHLRTAVVDTALKMGRAGINQGKSGNVSARIDGGFLITPTGMPYEELQPEHIVAMRMDGSFDGETLPSSEWRFHRDIYAARADAGAIVHTHSVHAAALSVLGRDVPAFHYMIAVAGGDSIRCAPYATFGTQQLSDHAVAALCDRRACLLAHHGAISLGSSLETALGIAIEVEVLAAMYLKLLPLGNIPLLPAEEMAHVLKKFNHYGQQRRP